MKFAAFLECRSAKEGRNEKNTQTVQEGKKKMRRVRVAVELDNEFVKLLRANLTVSETIRMSESEPVAAVSADVLHILGLAVLGEAMSIDSEQTRRKIPSCWRQHIDIIPEARKVVEPETTTA
jgi:hypothetical protein